MLRLLECWLLMLVVISAMCQWQVSAWTGSSSNHKINRTSVVADDWDAFKARFNKKYYNETEENERREIRRRIIVLIRSFNEQAVSGRRRFTLRENSLVDLTTQEFESMLGFRSQRNVVDSGHRVRRRLSKYQPPMPTYYNTVNVASLPTCVNWTALGWVGPVMNQGRCGSCWSYSSTGSLQAQFYNYSGQMVQLSQQNLIDCSFPQGNDGCNGGNMQNAFWYVQTNGIESLASYPDTSYLTGFSGSSCGFNANLSVMKVASWRDIESTSEAALQQAVAHAGPVSAGIDANSLEFQSYGGGIYSSSTCGSSTASLNHAILVVGYGVYDNQSYWLIQNSWGTDWGIGGYMMMARDANNMCGIATDATFPVISQSSSSSSKQSSSVNPSSDCPSSPPSPSQSASAAVGSSSSAAGPLMMVGARSRCLDLVLIVASVCVVIIGHR